MTTLVGRQFENYRIESTIGQGGMGTVYRAIDTTLMRPVAMKVMHADLAADPSLQQRFRQEARAAARLDHPSIVRVYYFGQQEDLIYIVMELVDGLSLGAYLRQLARLNQVVRLDEAITLIAQVADALGYAHQQGVVHRDIKPDNILVKRLDRPDRPGEPPLRAMVTDFGLAELVGSEMDTDAGRLMGTLPYMSPEQVLGRPSDGRSDIYSLGVILYQLATGRLPHEVSTPQDAAAAHQYGEIVAPRVLQPALPPRVESVILRALARRPENRHQTGDELAQALRGAVAALDGNHAAAATPDSASTIVSIIAELPALPAAPPTDALPTAVGAAVPMPSPMPSPAQQADVVWDMRPRRLQGSGFARVLVRNESPGGVTVALTPDDPTGAVEFDSARKQVSLVSGQMGIVDFYVSAARRPLFGVARPRPYRMHAEIVGSGRVDAPALEGVVEEQPAVPLWLTLLLLGLVPAMCGLSYWALQFLPL